MEHICELCGHETKTMTDMEYICVDCYWEVAMIGQNEFCTPEQLDWSVEPLRYID